MIETAGRFVSVGEFETMASMTPTTASAPRSAAQPSSVAQPPRSPWAFGGPSSHQHPQPSVSSSATLGDLDKRARL